MNVPEMKTRAETIAWWAGLVVNGKLTASNLLVIAECCIRECAARDVFIDHDRVGRLVLELLAEQGLS